MTFLELQHYFQTKYSQLFAKGKIVFNELVFNLSAQVKSPIDLVSKRNFVIDFQLKYLEKQFNAYWTDELPLAYLTNHAEFKNQTFYVNHNVLIPRTETELVFDIFNNHVKNIVKPNQIILDLCTGSGCLAISLAQLYPHNQIYGSDNSQRALKVANHNKGKYQIKNLEFLKADFLAVLNNISQPIDYVICNPPYLDKNDPAVAASVSYEPVQALFAKNHGLYFYEQFFQVLISNPNFKPQIFALEIGYNQKSAISKYCIQLADKYQYKIINDHQDLSRCVLLVHK